MRKKKLYILVGVLALLLVWVITNVVIYYKSAPDMELVKEAKEYCAKHGLNQSVVCMCDFSRHSGTPRFWIYDCEYDKVIASSLCSHGCGGGSTASKPVFSNESGSNCSSLGMYKIVELGTMDSDLRCLKLDGLQTTNSNARARNIYIHRNMMVNICRWGMWPAYMPLNSILSAGCFAVSDQLLDTLISLTEASPVLLYAYDI